MKAAPTKDKGDGLNERQRIFAHEYVACHNRTEAAKKAGYSPASAHMQGSRMLKNDKVVALVNELEQEIFDDCRIRRSEVNDWLRQQFEIVSDPDSDFYNPTVAATLLGHMMKTTGQAVTRIGGEKEGEPIRTESRQLGDMDMAARLAALEAIDGQDS